MSNLNEMNVGARWYVAHTYSGYENKVKASLEKIVENRGLQHLIYDIRVPVEIVIEKKGDKEIEVENKIFPGYVLCELALYDEGKGIDENGRKAVYERTWQFVRETPGVIGFVGGDRPTPLKRQEVDAILLDQPSAGPVAERPKVNFSVDETVKIVDGAFMGLTGQISMVDPDKGKLKVEVQVFGRKVPVDAEYWQVEKVSLEETLEPQK